MTKHIRSMILLVLMLAMFTIARGQEPVGPKTPPNGIPQEAEFYNGKWYKVFHDELGWKNAQARCARLGGQLAIIPDAATWNFVKPRCQMALLWLGASDDDTPGFWKWSDGTSVTFTAWVPGEPNNIDGKEHYLSTWKGGWNDVAASGRFPKGDKLRVTGYVCEWKDR
jgi:hypothetical protein